MVAWGRSFIANVSIQMFPPMKTSAVNVAIMTENNNPTNLRYSIHLTGQINTGPKCFTLSGSFPEK